MVTEPHCRFQDGRYVQPDGEECDTPKRDHCSARKTCANHLAWGEQTCARCVGRTRANLKHIGQYAGLLDTAANETGRVDTELAMLAGPTCDPEAWSWRKVAAKQGLAWHVSQDEDDDEQDPERVLTTWAQMLSEDYRLPRPDHWDVTNAAAFLDRILHRVAQDEEQDFPQMSRELRRCRNHLDTALRVRLFVDRGVPCPICVAERADDPVRLKLVREYPHWCDLDDCHRIHVETDELDVWVCPRNRAHSWTHADYSNRLEERKGA